MARFRSNIIMAFSLASCRVCVFICQFITKIEPAPAMKMIKQMDRSKRMLLLDRSLPWILAADTFIFIRGPD